MPIKLYNTLTRKLEEFKPIEAGKLSMYSCGVTTYDDAHLGHARQAIVFDVARKFFESQGYEVAYVRNYTDIDDKIIKRANERRQDCLKLSAYYVEESRKDIERLKVDPAVFEPKVTENIPEIIEFISGLIEKDFAYPSDGNVFFDVAKDADYGKLSNRKRDELLNENEIPGKRNPQDFTLWKKAKEGEPSWESPWGPGRPGWHIECSVMAKKYLGEEIDIHGGGLDLIFPHHENEIAQSEALSGKQFARVWLHNGLVAINGQKMSKSLGNFLTIKDALKKYLPDEIRFVVLGHNFGSQLDFSEELFVEARKRLAYFYGTLLKVRKFKQSSGALPEATPDAIKSLGASFNEAMSDNLNTAVAIAAISKAFNSLNQVLEDKDLAADPKSSIFSFFLSEFEKITRVLRILDEDPEEYLRNLRAQAMSEMNLDGDMIQKMLDERRGARSAGDFKTADQIRDRLKEMGISVRDGAEGSEWDFIYE